MLRIAEAREARGWTQERLAQAMSTTQQTIQRWESGQVDPKISKVVEISKALGVTVSFLLDMDDYEEVELPREEWTTAEERELVALYRNMDAPHRATIMDTARAFSALSEKDGQDARRAVRVGTLDAVR